MVFNTYGFMKGLMELIVSAFFFGVFAGAGLAGAFAAVNWILP